MAEKENVENEDYSTAKKELLNWAAAMLKQELEMKEVKEAILKRIAEESDIKPSRIPAPLNITEIGGYFNLMMKLRKEELQKQQEQLSSMLMQTLSSILGLPMQTPKGVN